uniref:Uncharacterized protein n=1 Tax=Heterorhabditis bacteriophora TaxID=37862 RepID=A0A1I7XHL5_HETBA
MRNERESYDARLNYERQRIWEEFARRRAQRWHEFHKKYPDGPPGSIKWDWSWSSDANQKPSQALKLFRRIVLIYMACFFVVTIVQLFLVKIGNINSLSNEARRRQLQAIERNDREKIEEMMRKRPMEFMTPTEMDYMNQMPVSMDDKNSEFQEHDSSDAVYSSKLDDLDSLGAPRTQNPITYVNLINTPYSYTLLTTSHDAIH